MMAWWWPTRPHHDPQLIDGATLPTAERNPVFAEALGTAGESGHVEAAEALGGYSRLPSTRRVAALGVEIPSPVWVAVVQQPVRQAVAAADDLSDVSRDVAAAPG